MLRFVLAFALVACALAASDPAYPPPSAYPSPPAYPGYPPQQQQPGYPSQEYPSQQPRYPSQGYPPQEGYGSQFSQQELQNVADFARRVAAEKDFALERAKMVIDQKASLLKLLNHISDVVVPSIRSKAAEQRGALDYILKNLNSKYHRLIDVESAVAGQSAIGSRNVALINPLWDDINPQSLSNSLQDGSLEKIRSLLDDAEAKLKEKLAATTGEADDDTASLNNQLNSVIFWTNMRKCYRDYVFVEIDSATGKGSTYLNIPEKVFNGTIPVVTCALQGFVTYLNLDQTQSASSGYPPVYPDDNNDITVAVDCKALANKVLVDAFDQSRGDGNDFQGVYVEVRACTFANQAPA